MAQEHSGAAWIERFWHILAQKSTPEGPEEAEEAKERAKGQKKEPSRGQRGEVGGQRGLWRHFGVDLVDGSWLPRVGRRQVLALANANIGNINNIDKQ